MAEIASCVPSCFNIPRELRYTQTCIGLVCIDVKFCTTTCLLFPWFFNGCSCIYHFLTQLINMFQWSYRFLLFDSTPCFFNLPTINQSHSNNCCLETKPPIMCYPFLFKSKFILSCLVVHIHLFRIIKISWNNSWPSNLTNTFVSKGIWKFCKVRLPCSCCSCTLGTHKH